MLGKYAITLKNTFFYPKRNKKDFQAWKDGLYGLEKKYELYYYVKPLLDWNFKSINVSHQRFLKKLIILKIFLRISCINSDVNPQCHESVMVLLVSL